MQTNDPIHLLVVALNYAPELPGKYVSQMTLGVADRVGSAISGHCDP